MLQHKNLPSLDDECILIAAEISQDDIGNEVFIDVENNVFCAEIATSQSEFYKAAQQDVRMERLLIVSSFDYGGEKQVRYIGDVFDVYRIYHRIDELIELYLEKRAGVSRESG